MVSTLKSAGTLFAPGSVDQTENDGIPVGPRIELARRAMGDIADVILVLREGVLNDLTPPILQMVQQRLHALVMGAFDLLDPEGVPVGSIHAELHPSEQPSAAQGGLR